MSIGAFSRFEEPAIQFASPVRQRSVGPQVVVEKQLIRPVVEIPVCGQKSNKMLRDIPERFAHPELLPEARIYRDVEREHVMRQRTVVEDGVLLESYEASPETLCVDQNQLIDGCVVPRTRAGMAPCGETFDQNSENILGIKAIAWDPIAQRTTTTVRQFATELGSGMYVAEPRFYVMEGRQPERVKPKKPSKMGHKGVAMPIEPAGPPKDQPVQQTPPIQPVQPTAVSKLPAQPQQALKNAPTAPPPPAAPPAQSKASGLASKFLQGKQNPPEQPAPATPAPKAAGKFANSPFFAKK